MIPSATPSAAPSAQAVGDFIGLLGYSALGSFALLSQDAAYAPELRERLVLSRMAARELGEIDVIENLVAEHGSDLDAVMASFRDIMNDFLVRAQPRDWWERLIRSYVGHNLLQDLVEDLSRGLPASVADSVAPCLARSGHDDYVVGLLQPVLDAEPQLAARLALWGRRVVGEALTLVARLFADHPDLAELLPADGEARGRVASLTGRLQAGHARRLGRLGLTS